MYLRRKCYADAAETAKNVVKEVVENTVPESKGEEKAKEGLMSWIKKNPGKTALIGTGIAALGGGAYLGYKHHKKKQAEEQAEALAEEAAQTAYSDTYDYYMRLFSDEEDVKFTEDDLKGGKFASYLGAGSAGILNPAAFIGAGRGNKVMKDALRNGEDLSTARIKGEKKAATVGALVGAGIPAAAALYLCKSNPVAAIGAAVGLGALGAGTGALGAYAGTHLRAEGIRKRSRDRRDK